MFQSTRPGRGNSRVFIAFLLAFSILITPIAAVATPAIDKPSPATTKANETLNATGSTAASLPAPVPVPLAPSISASMVDSFPAGFDVDLDGKAEPGDKIRYPTTITNAAAATASFTILTVADTPSVTNATTSIDTQTTSVTMVVNTLGDAPDLVLDGVCDTDAGTAGDQCTLRAVVQETNNAASNDTINFDPVLNGGTITLDTALNAITGNVVINGPGASLLTVQRNTAVGTPDFRIFTINASQTVSISGLTIMNGRMPADVGGGIRNAGTLTLTNCNLYGNTAGLGGAITNFGGVSGVATSTVTLNNCNIGGTGPGQSNTASVGSGGGIQNLDNLIINNSSISGNVAPGGGGGIANEQSWANLTITSSSVTNNSAVQSGGGISNQAAITIANSTISGNRSDLAGAGISTNGSGSSLTVVNSTITNNHADNDDDSFGGGGGITAFESPTLLRNTIVANNFRRLGTIRDDLDGTKYDPTSAFNLIGDGTGMTGISHGVNGNQVGTSGAPIDARLGPLANTGGPTQTHALLAGSPALDAGDNTLATNAGLTTDQRGAGFARILDAADAGVVQTVDIGAFEADPSVEDISDKATNEDIALPTFVFNVGDSATAFDSIIATSSNQLLVPDLNITIGPNTPSTRTLSITPAPNASGTTTITVTVTKTVASTIVTMSDTFVLTVTAVNDNPTTTGLVDVNVNEDSVNTVVTLTSSFNDVEDGSAGLIYTVQANTNPALFTSTNISSGVLTLDYAPNGFGTSDITIRATDSGGLFVEDTFTVNVASINDAPTLDALGNLSIDEDAAQTVNLSNITDGGNEGQTLTVTALSNNTSIIPDPAVTYTSPNTTGSLSFTPVANQNGGPVTITVTVTDSGGTLNGGLDSFQRTFTVTVNAVNDEPGNGVPGAQSVTENSTLTFSAANSNAINISDVDAGSNPLQVTLTATNGLMTLGTTAGLSFTTGDGVSDATMTFTGPIGSINAALNGLVFTPTPGFDGAASIQIITNDQGSTGSGGALSDTDTVTINVLDGGTLSFSAATFTIGESGPQATITVNRSGGANGEARIGYATSDGSATGGGTDYTTATGTLIFANGVTTQTFTVPINNDTIDEPDETVNLTLSNPQGSGALGSPSTAVLTLTDDDAAPAISINDPSVTEGNSGPVNLVFTVTLSNPSSQTVTLNYATGNNTAEAPGDFVAIPTTLLTFNPLETSKQITVLVNGDTDFEANEALEVNLSSPTNATLADTQGLGFIVNDDAPGGTIAFSAATFTVNEDAGSATITVNRTGTTTEAVTVDYATSDISASERSDYTTAVGTLSFAAGATSATFTVLVNVDSFAEGAELVQLSLTNPSSGVALGVPQTATLQIDNVANALSNTIDDPGHFVDQHYHDFLNRVADPSGRAFWIDQITSCGSDATCVEIRRINVSAAFFLSIEFQETGVPAFLTHQAAFGSALPGYRPFERDTQALQRNFVFGAPGADAVLEANKVAFFNAFVLRPEFTAIYGSLTNEQYVDALILNTGVTFTAAERDALVNGLNAFSETRATVLRKITEKGNFKQAQFNRAFVYMQYVGYLRRAPADPPDNNLDGFNFWLNKLNQFNGNFVDAELVKAFIISGEYRQRFGP